MFGNLRRVDAQHPDGVGGPVTQGDDDGVAVEYVDDARARRGHVALGAEPPAAGRSRSDDHQHHDRAPGDHGRHDTAVRRRDDGAQLLARRLRTTAGSTKPDWKIAPR